MGPIGAKSKLWHRNTPNPLEFGPWRGQQLWQETGHFCWLPLVPCSLCTWLPRLCVDQLLKSSAVPQARGEWEFCIGPFQSLWTQAQRCSGRFRPWSFSPSWLLRALLCRLLGPCCPPYLPALIPGGHWGVIPGSPGSEAGGSWGNALLCELRAPSGGGAQGWLGVPG